MNANRMETVIVKKEKKRMVKYRTQEISWKRRGIENRPVLGLKISFQNNSVCIYWLRTIRALNQ